MPNPRGWSVRVNAPYICGCSWVRPHYIYRQLRRLSTVLLFDYSQSQSDEVRTARLDTTKPHTSLRQVKHPVHASVRPPYFTRQQMCFFFGEGVGDLHTVWQGVQLMAESTQRVHIATGCFIIAQYSPSSGSRSCCLATTPPPALQCSALLSLNVTEPYAIPR